jgi:hypothetical protein
VPSSRVKLGQPPPVGMLIFRAPISISRNIFSRQAHFHTGIAPISGGGIRESYRGSPASTTNGISASLSAASARLGAKPATSRIASPRVFAARIRDRSSRCPDSRRHRGLSASGQVPNGRPRSRRLRLPRACHNRVGETLCPERPPRCYGVTADIAQR